VITMTEHNDTVVDDTPAEDRTDAGQRDAGQPDGTGESDSAAEASPVAGGGDAGSDTDAGSDSDTDSETDDDTDTDGAESAAAPRRRPAKVADLDGDIDVDVDGDRAAVSIVDSDEGRVPRRLVGQDGKVLEALQELTRLAVQSATGERSRLMLDVAGHRAERRSTLVELAHSVIEQVKATGEKAALDPMTAFERKVVHDEVLAAGLSSESDGVEPRRFVVILPA
jgi:spoIIIJ-associated protein